MTEIQHLGLGASQIDQYRREENGYEAILQVLQQARSTSFSEEEVNVILMAMSSQIHPQSQRMLLTDIMYRYLDQFDANFNWKIAGTKESGPYYVLHLQA